MPFVWQQTNKTVEIIRGKYLKRQKWYLISTIYIRNSSILSWEIIRFKSDYNYFSNHKSSGLILAFRYSKGNTSWTPYAEDN